MRVVATTLTALLLVVVGTDVGAGVAVAVVDGALTQEHGSSLVNPGILK